MAGGLVEPISAGFPSAGWIGVGEWRQADGDTPGRRGVACGQQRHVASSSWSRLPRSLQLTFRAWGRQRGTRGTAPAPRHCAYAYGCYVHW